MSVTVSSLLAPLRLGSPLRGGYRIDAIDEGAASVTLRAPGIEPLVVRLRPRDAAQVCFAVTPSLNVSCVGRDLTPDAESALRVVVAMLRANDRGEVPASLPRRLPVANEGGREQVRVESGERRRLRAHRLHVRDVVRVLHTR